MFSQAFQDQYSVFFSFSTVCIFPCQVGEVTSIIISSCCRVGETPPGAWIQGDHHCVFVYSTPNGQHGLDSLFMLHGTGHMLSCIKRASSWPCWVADHWICDRLVWCWEKVLMPSGFGHFCAAPQNSSFLRHSFFFVFLKTHARWNQSSDSKDIQYILSFPWQFYDAVVLWWSAVDCGEHELLSFKSFMFTVWSAVQCPNFF